MNNAVAIDPYFSGQHNIQIFSGDFLLDCPHCGCKPDLLHKKDIKLIGENKTKNVFLYYECMVGQWMCKVYCAECGATGGTFLTDGPSSGLSVTEERSVKNWNRRVVPILVLENL